MAQINSVAASKVETSKLPAVVAGTVRGFVERVAVSGIALAWHSNNGPIRSHRCIAGNGRRRLHIGQRSHGWRMCAPLLSFGQGGLVSTAHDYPRSAATVLDEERYDGARQIKSESERPARRSSLTKGIDHIELPIGEALSALGFGARGPVGVLGFVWGGSYSLLGSIWTESFPVLSGAVFALRVERIDVAHRESSRFSGHKRVSRKSFI